MHASQDVHKSRKDAAFEQLSSISSQQARRKIILPNNELINKHTTEETLKQNVNLFMQNLDQISNLSENAKNKQVR